MIEKRAAIFRDGYEKAKTWIEAENLCKGLEQVWRQELIRAFDVVNAYTGLDMRQEFYQRILKGISNHQ